MTTENQHREKSGHVESPGQMRGWFKLMETIRQNEPPPTSIESHRSSSSGSPILTPETNGRRSITLESLASQSPTDLPSPLTISIPSPPPVTIEPTATKTATKRSSTRPKRITIRKSTRSKDLNATKSDSILPDRQYSQRLSHDHSSNGSLVPFATDLHNLPGLHQDDSRDERFLNYLDMNSLAKHLNACLFIEKRPSFSFTKQHIFKTRHNILTKIFRLDYIKTLQRYVEDQGDLFTDASEATRATESSSTALSFKTDWAINRRGSSASRHARKNFFHVLQLNPKRHLFSNTDEQRLSEGPQPINVESIKNILMRTYYPHLHKAIASGEQFGAKAKLLNRQDPLATPQSPSIPLSVRERGRKRKQSEVVEKPAPIVMMPRRVSEEIPAVPVSIPTSPNKQVNHRPKRSVVNNDNNNNLKRSKRKRFVSPPPPASSSSGDETLPDQLPKPTLIKNGLRSSYYKASSEIDGTSTSPKHRSSRKRSHPSASLPNFYTGIFESEDDTSSHLDYQLPYDIFWFSQKQSTAGRPKKRRLRSNHSSYQEITENLYSDASIRENLLASNTHDRSPVCACEPSSACGPQCTHQRIRHHQWFDDLEVVHREKQTPTLHATSPIDKGMFLCEYVGEIVSRDTSSPPTHSISLTEHLLIDASRMGNLARFARHSSSSNCFFEQWWVDGLPRMCLFTSRAIKAGEELTYNHPSPRQSRLNGRKTERPAKMEDLTEEEKSIVRETSVFLQRNLRRIKARRACKQRDKQQQLVEGPSLLFLAQNYYHPDCIEQEKVTQHTDALTRRDLFDLFYVHLRRSHFARSGRCSLELIDTTSSYAQLAQLTYILNELFESILNYKCHKSDVYPSNALKKCPLKRLFPMYYELISKPMDLSIIRQKLDAGEYLSYQSFEDDLLLLFTNATSYCGEDSDVGRAVSELRTHFLHRLKIHYRSAIDLFPRSVTIKSEDLRWAELKDFVSRLHEKEVFDGDIRQTLYRVIFTIDEMDLLQPAPTPQRSTKSVPIKEHLVHCRCGSFFDETVLAQCYACQLWQHASCIPLSDLSAPYFCFECHPTCQSDPLSCAKLHVCIPLNSSSKSITTDQPTSYSTLTRPDGFLLRINECYQVLQPDETVPPSSYDIFAVERLWIDQQGTGQVSGFFYRRPHETFPEANRKFFSQELIRSPATQETLPISWVRRPCHVLDLATFCKGKPVSESTSRLSTTDLFVCEYRTDKSGRTFTRLPKSKHGNLNSKSYCFDSYLEKLVIKREHRSEQQPEEPRVSSRRRPHYSLKFTAKQFDEKSSHIDGLIEKIYCRSHPSSSIPSDTKLSLEQFFLPSPISSSRLRSREKNRPTTATTRRSRSDQQIISHLLDELLSSVCF